MEIERSKSQANELVHYSAVYFFKEGREDEVTVSPQQDGSMGTATRKFWILDPLKSWKLNTLKLHFQQSNAPINHLVFMSKYSQSFVNEDRSYSYRQANTDGFTDFVILSLSTKFYLLMVPHRCLKVVKGATKLYFMQFLRVVIVLFGKGLYKSSFSTQIFMIKLGFLLSVFSFLMLLFLKVFSFYFSCSMF